MASWGSVGRVQLSEVHLARMGRTGLWQDWTEGQPDAWSGYKVFPRYNGGHGFRLRSAELNWTKCLQTNSGLNGWELFNCASTQFLGCRSEWAGVRATTAPRERRQCCGGGAVLRLDHHRNSHNGFLIDGSGGAAVPLTLSGCVLRRDGSDGGNNRAGINVTGYFNGSTPATVALTGCEVHPGSNDDGSGKYPPTKRSGGRTTHASGRPAATDQSATTAGSKDSTSAIVATGCDFATGPVNAPVLVARRPVGYTCIRARLGHLHPDGIAPAHTGIAAHLQPRADEQPGRAQRIRKRRLRPADPVHVPTGILGIQPPGTVTITARQ